MRMTLRLLVALTFGTVSATASLAAQSAAASGGKAPSATQSAHKPGIKAAPGTRESTISKGAVGISAVGSGVGGSDSKRATHIKKKVDSSQANGVSAPQPPQGNAVGGIGRNAVAVKINANGAMQVARPGLGIGVTRNASTGMIKGASVMPHPTQRNAALITGTGMAPKGTAPPTIRPAVKNNASINGTGMMGKN